MSDHIFIDIIIFSAGISIGLLIACTISLFLTRKLEEERLR